MSKDKSRIKDILHHDDLRDSLVWAREGERPVFADTIATVFEDASIRFSQGSSSSSDGLEFVDSFARSIVQHLYMFSNAHTFIVAFDDKRHVPERKRATQASRRQQLERTCERRQVDEWH